MRALIVTLLGVLAAAPVFADAELDKKLVKRMQEFGVKWWKARPKNKFFKWNRDVRVALLDEARALGPIPEGSWIKVRQAFAKSLKKHGPKGKGKAKVWLDNPYEPPHHDKMWAHVSGGGKNKGLVIGLHGGGEGAGSPDKGTWRMKGCMEIAPQGLVISGDNWNTVQGEKQILSLIEIAKAQYDIDPDRVYVAGFSMGGTGSWHMAGRFPDLLAGAAPCAGVVMAQPKSRLFKKEEVAAIQYGIVPNVRNLAMYYFIGLADNNCPPGTYLYVADMLEELKRDDQTGYRKIQFKTYPGLAHAFPPGEPSKCKKWLEEQRRETFPETIVWEYAMQPYPLPVEADKTDRIVQHWFYWIRHDWPVDRMSVKAHRNGNEFDIEVLGAEREGMFLMLNPKMVDPAQDVVVRIDGEEFYRGKPQPDFVTVVESFNAKLDRSLFFDRKIPLWK